MNFLTFIFKTVVEFLNVDFLKLWFFPFVALAFLATVPCIIRTLLTWR